LRAWFVAAVIVSAASWAPQSLARNTEYHLSIADVQHHPDYAAKVGDDVAFYFGAQRTPPIRQNFGEFVSNKKSNSFGKSDEAACAWAMLSALKEFRDRATSLGGNAVVGVISYYQKQAQSSETEYDCHAGGFVAGVALKGTVVKLAQ
jgi:uncharacterized protein YbjQ (UPF0145 family)